MQRTGGRGPRPPRAAPPETLVVHLPACKSQPRAQHLPGGLSSWGFGPLATMPPCGWAWGREEVEEGGAQGKWPAWCCPGPTRAPGTWRRCSLACWPVLMPQDRWLAAPESWRPPPAGQGCPRHMELLLPQLKALVPPRPWCMCSALVIPFPKDGGPGGLGTPDSRASRKAEKLERGGAGGQNRQAHLMARVSVQLVAKKEWAGAQGSAVSTRPCVAQDTHS